MQTLKTGSLLGLGGVLAALIGQGFSGFSSPTVDRRDHLQSSSISNKARSSDLQQFGMSGAGLNARRRESRPGNPRGRPRTDTVDNHDREFDNPFQRNPSSRYRAKSSQDTRNRRRAHKRPNASNKRRQSFENGRRSSGNLNDKFHFDEPITFSKEIDRRAYHSEPKHYSRQRPRPDQNDKFDFMTPDGYSEIEHIGSSEMFNMQFEKILENNRRDEKTSLEASSNFNSGRQKPMRESNYRPREVRPSLSDWTREIEMNSKTYSVGNSEKNVQSRKTRPGFVSHEFDLLSSHEFPSDFGHSNLGVSKSRKIIRQDDQYKSRPTMKSQNEEYFGPEVIIVGSQDHFTDLDHEQNSNHYSGNKQKDPSNMNLALDSLSHEK